MKRKLVLSIIAALLLVPAAAAAHSTVMKAHSRFWVLSSHPPHGSEVGNRFNPYAICRHGISDDPQTASIFKTLGGRPLKFNGVDFHKAGRPRDGAYRYARRHNKWQGRLLTIHAIHQRPVWEVRAVNPGSRKERFIWHCFHP
jgi:hypothetical protein